ncbi:septum formation initiator family protein [Desulfosudis oleivorans]|uniref:Conserved hypothetical membrane protein n=1 Tax=Desulfosudis oleivorans (strain DSM 6200 / JCM 39069 / Hxd3) TaxID=96561 RepID=A8ZXX0_DESOH|nr:cell division protein FtsL [Desulfosudis oleivorans]ABW68597.1 conserved hypothetical membrane protein [Desulfosudis oleivorans Hxd3]
MAEKKKQRKSGDRTILLWLAVLLLLTGEFFCFAWCRVQSVDLRYDITRNTDLAATLAARQKDLKIELARLRSPTRIMDIARTRLDMVMPNTDQVELIP